MAFNSRLLQESTVYAFHVPSINAIKVGFGTDGRTRMLNYSKQYALSSSANSLREWKLPSPSLASSIETACHRALLQADFHRISQIVDDQEARELFNLGPHSYEEAVIIVAEAIEETISMLYEALGQLKPLTQEKARQQKESAQRKRNSVREEKKRKNEEEERHLIAVALPAIQHRWQQEMVPFIKVCESAEIVRKQFRYHQGILSSLWNGKQSAASRMRRWDSWPTVKQFIPRIFHAARHAKAFYCEMTKRHGKYAELAAQGLGLSLKSPGGHDLPLVGIYPDKQGMAFLEVRIVVQTATGFSGDDAADLINNDKELMALVSFANQHSTPELK